MNSPSSVAQPTPPDSPQVNILIVDDEPRNLTVLESVLDDPGYRLVRANSGQEALLALMAEEFAVLILDVRMPGMTGFELAQIIKERRKTAQIPIIFLTAYYNEDQHVLEGYGSGAVDYLHKPVNTAVLRSKVAVFADLYSKGRALEIANRSLLAEVGERRKAEENLRELNATLDRRITERTTALGLREAELRDANRRKDEFLATLAHELRNPLAPVRNAVQLLRLKGLATPELQYSAEVIERQVQVMSRLIDDLMDVSRIDQGKIELRQDWVTAQDILRDAVEVSRPLIDECGHQLLLNLPAHALSLHADRTRLTQAFMNLLNNAAKYMDRGGRIEIDARSADDQVVVVVKDSGIGIPGDRLKYVFEMFSQVETALTRSRGGLGIGLSLTQRLVEMHGGTVLARSQGLGHGSEFEVRLPLRPALSASPALPASTGGQVDRFEPGTPLRILIADDNRDACATLAGLLELMGHQVRQAHDGQAAVEVSLQFDPQVVLLDIGMPKLNGYQACQQLRAQAGGASRTIVACTGWGQADDRRRSQEAGFDQHLVKPVDPAVLADLLATVAAAGTTHTAH